jgi:site-specific recombinase XerD
MKRAGARAENKRLATNAALLFCNKVGKRMVRNKVALKLQATHKDLGIERAALHAFRHMASSELIENGVAPSVMQRQTRHSDARITLQKYAPVIGDAQQRAVDTVAGRVLELAR